MPSCPEVDSVYYKVSERYIAEIPGQTFKGIQFYLDLDGGNIAAGFQMGINRNVGIPCSLSNRKVL